MLQVLAMLLGLGASLSVFWIGMTYLGALAAAILVGGPILGFLQVAIGFQTYLSFFGALLRFGNELPQLVHNEDLSVWAMLWSTFSNGLKGVVFDAFRAEQSFPISYFLFAVLSVTFPLILSSALLPTQVFSHPLISLGVVAWSFLSIVPMAVGFLPHFAVRVEGIFAENHRRHLNGEPKLGLLMGLWVGWRAFASFLPIYFRFFGNVLIIVPRYVFAFLRGRLIETMIDDVERFNAFTDAVEVEASRFGRNPLERPEDELPPELQDLHNIVDIDNNPVAQEPVLVINDHESSYSGPTAPAAVSAANALYGRYSVYIDTPAKLEGVLTQIDEWKKRNFEEKEDQKTEDSALFKLKTEAAKAGLSRISNDREPYNVNGKLGDFKEDFRKEHSYDVSALATIKQLLALLWLGIHDEELIKESNPKYRAEEGKLRLKEQIYRFQRSKNLEGGIDDRAPYHSPCCHRGTYTRLVQTLENIHPDVPVLPAEAVTMGKQYVAARTETFRQIVQGKKLDWLAPTQEMKPILDCIGATVVKGLLEEGIQIFSLNKRLNEFSLFDLCKAPVFNCIKAKLKSTSLTLAALESALASGNVGGVLDLIEEDVLVALLPTDIRIESLSEDFRLKFRQFLSEQSFLQEPGIVIQLVVNQVAMTHLKAYPGDLEKVRGERTVERIWPSIKQEVDKVLKERNFMGLFDRTARSLFSKTPLFDSTKKTNFDNALDEKNVEQVRKDNEKRIRKEAARKALPSYVREAALIELSKKPGWFPSFSSKVKPCDVINARNTNLIWPKIKQVVIKRMQDEFGDAYVSETEKEELSTLLDTAPHVSFSSLIAPVVQTYFETDEKMSVQSIKTILASQKPFEPLSDHLLPLIKEALKLKPEQDLSPEIQNAFLDLIKSRTFPEEQMILKQLIVNQAVMEHLEQHPGQIEFATDDHSAILIWDRIKVRVARLLKARGISIDVDRYRGHDVVNSWGSSCDEIWPEGDTVVWNEDEADVFKKLPLFKAVREFSAPAHVGPMYSDHFASTSVMLEEKAAEREADGVNRVDVEQRRGCSISRGHGIHNLYQPVVGIGALVLPPAAVHENQFPVVDDGSLPPPAGAVGGRPPGFN